MVRGGGIYAITVPNRRSTIFMRNMKILYSIQCSIHSILYCTLHCIPYIIFILYSTVYSVVWRKDAIVENICSAKMHVAVIQPSDDEEQTGLASREEIATKSPALIFTL